MEESFCSLNSEWFIDGDVNRNDNEKECVFWMFSLLGTEPPTHRSSFDNRKEERGWTSCRFALDSKAAEEGFKFQIHSLRSIDIQCPRSPHSTQLLPAVLFNWKTRLKVFVAVRKVSRRTKLLFDEHDARLGSQSNLVNSHDEAVALSTFFIWWNEPCAAYCFPPER